MKLFLFANKWLLLMSNKDGNINSPNIGKTDSTVKTSGLICSLQRLIVYVNFLQSMASHFLHIINCWQTGSSSGSLGNNITYLFAQNLRTPGVFAAVVSMAFCPFRQ